MLHKAAEAAGVQIDVVARRGEEPYREIVQEAVERRSDLIITRRRGKRSFLSNLLIGEMVSKVVGHAHCMCCSCRAPRRCGRLRDIGRGRCVAEREECHPFRCKDRAECDLPLTLVPWPATMRKACARKPKRPCRCPFDRFGRGRAGRKPHPGRQTFRADTGDGQGTACRLDRRRPAWRKQFDSYPFRRHHAKSGRTGRHPGAGGVRGCKVFDHVPGRQIVRAVQEFLGWREHGQSPQPHDSVMFMVLRTAPLLLSSRTSKRDAVFHSSGKQGIIAENLASMVIKAGYMLVAEGLEPKEHCKKSSRGILYGQGYLFGLPENTCRRRQVLIYQ